MIDYVDDRDRWTWAHPMSHEINDAIFFHTGLLHTEMTQEMIKAMFEKIDNLPNIETLAEQGKILSAQTNRLVNCLVRGATYHFMTVKDIKSPLGFTKYKVACCDTRLFRSEVGGKLMDSDVDFSICWSYQMKEKTFWLSLRSNNQRADVSVIAQQLDPTGGGHRNAAGCTVNQFFELLSDLI